MGIGFSSFDGSVYFLLLTPSKWDVGGQKVLPEIPKGALKGRETKERIRLGPAWGTADGAVSRGFSA